MVQQWSSVRDPTPANFCNYTAIPIATRENPKTKRPSGLPRWWCGPLLRRRRSCRRTLSASSFCWSVSTLWNRTARTQNHQRANASERHSAGIAGGWISETWWTPLCRTGRVGSARPVFEVMRRYQATAVSKENGNAASTGRRDTLAVLFCAGGRRAGGKTSLIIVGAVLL